MTDILWQEAVEAVRPYVVRLSTPEHAGSAFLFAVAAEGGICGFATAAHALAHASAWEQPVRIEHAASGFERLLRPTERSIVIDEETDTAALVFLRDDFPLPDTLLPMTPEHVAYRVGVEVGWVGFPSVARDRLCFFSGRISSWNAEQQTYLVDGVAVNGVSGGPAFHVDEAGQPVLLGVVSAYLPNKAAGGALPGLSVIQHIGHLEKWVASLRSLEGAYRSRTTRREPSR
ncbi:MAG: hypothetical protein H6Q03_342 [Acidobacteria bacterium]|nr:hypothetical protein [Acidobacteriota bacterium]